MNNEHKIPFQQRPRVLVDRGSYQVTKTGISDNLATAKAFSETNGLMDKINFVLYSGQATILIEARQQGVCELVTDMVTHFIVWSRPMLCDSQGFKELGLPMSVSSCELLSASSEDGIKFQTTVTVPYMKEEQWRVRNDAIIMQKVDVYVTSAMNSAMAIGSSTPTTGSTSPTTQSKLVSVPVSQGGIGVMI